MKTANQLPCWAHGLGVAALVFTLGALTNVAAFAAQAAGTAEVLPRPDFHFPGNVGQTKQLKTRSDILRTFCVVTLITPIDSLIEGTSLFVD